MEDSSPMNGSFCIFICVLFLQAHLMVPTEAHRALSGVAHIVAQTEAYLARAMWDVRVGTLQETAVALMRSRDLVRDLKDQVRAAALDVSHLHMDGKFLHLAERLQDAIELVSAGKASYSTIFPLLDLFKKLEGAMARAGLVAPIRGWYM